MKIFKTMTTAAITLTALFALSACDGEAENAGEEVDDAMSKVEEKAKDAGNAIEDLCEDAKEGVNAKDTDC
ncbi:hypothetical protein RS130_02660 [Paraglaciecola aquimarina]|uniref:Lipoprotein n=1 Tax=Paraglaciecola aquimarina TaxID=1235557 RepID=A0ABU3SSL5_9ALTE|nr:hypothetical protein [Paraglaciecola aquimarina]MDU0352974.1 hypothetical protein [Paraglaciecola aquimarina]